jgi:hypothetical protein
MASAVHPSGIRVQLIVRLAAVAAHDGPAPLLHGAHAFDGKRVDAAVMLVLAVCGGKACCTPAVCDGANTTLALFAKRVKTWCYTCAYRSKGLALLQILDHLWCWMDEIAHSLGQLQDPVVDLGRQYTRQAQVCTRE